MATWVLTLPQITIALNTHDVGPAAGTRIASPRPEPAAHPRQKTPRSLEVLEPSRAAAGSHPSPRSRRSNPKRPARSPRSRASPPRSSATIPNRGAADPQSVSTTASRPAAPIAYARRSTPAPGRGSSRSSAPRHRTSPSSTHAGHTRAAADWGAPVERDREYHQAAAAPPSRLDRPSTCPASGAERSARPPGARAMTADLAAADHQGRRAVTGQQPGGAGCMPPVAAVVPCGEMGGPRRGRRRCTPRRGPRGCPSSDRRRGGAEKQRRGRRSSRGAGW